METSNVESFRYANMNLDDLHVGDEFHFGRIYYDWNRALTDSITFTGDTMVLTLTSNINDTITCDAHFRVKPGRSTMINGTLVPVRDTTIELTWCINGEQLTNLSEVETESHIVAEDPLYDDVLPFEFSRDIEYEFKDNSFFTVVKGSNYGDYTGYILGGESYYYLSDTMNVHNTCNCPVNGIGFSSYHTYSLNHGLVTTFSDYDGGWTRLKQHH